MKRIITAAALAALAAAPAFSADWVSEARLGVAAHDLTDHAEDGPQITGELLLNPVGLGFLGAPRPLFNVSINANGFTDLIGASLLWDRELGERWTIEGGFGLAYHDGVNELDLSDPFKAVEIKETRALLGSSILFRTALGVNYSFTERWGAGVFYEHYSHGQILAEGRNQGLDELGVRINYRFGRR
ncbi:MAG: acyloxyacyl hydrolase [Oceanicaulis sp.]